MSALVAHIPDDVPRRLLSVEDLRRMIEAGIIDEDENVELLDGELVTMAAKGFAHERLKGLLVRLLNRSSEGVFVGIEPSLRLDTHVLVEPDILVCREADLAPAPEGYFGVPGRNLLLLVEVAATSLRQDRVVKAALYARYGVPEYWVLDTNEPAIWRHLDPQPGGYRRVDKVAADETIRPSAPELAAASFSLAQFG